MRILSIEEASGVFQCTNFVDLVQGVDWQYPIPMPTHSIPKDSGAKVALARRLANSMLERGPAIFWVTEFGIWPSSEHIDLFSRYRLSFGETRPLSEAPVHILAEQDYDIFISLICIGLFFVWDIEIINYELRLAVTLSHDEWLECRYAPNHEDLASKFETDVCGPLVVGKKV